MSHVPLAASPACRRPAAEEQSSVAGEINRSISAVNAQSNDAATSAARVDEAVRDLTALAGKLREPTGTFRVA